MKKLDGPKIPKGRKSPEIAALATFQSQVDSLQNKSIIVGDDPALTQYEQGIAKLADDLNKYMKASGDAAKGAELFNRGQQALQATLNQSRQQNVVSLDQYRDAVNAKLAADKMQLDNQVERIGMGQQEYERQTQINKVYQDYARIIENLQKQRAQKGANTALIDGQIAEQTRARDIAVT